LSNVWNDDGAVPGKDHVEDGAFAGNFADILPPPGFEPDAAFVGEAEARRISAQVFGSQAGEGVIAGLGWSVEDGIRGEGCEPGVLLTATWRLGFDLFVAHVGSSQSGPRLFARESDLVPLLVYR
jgi:hypothetical protein